MYSNIAIKQSHIAKEQKLIFNECSESSPITNIMLANVWNYVMDSGSIPQSAKGPLPIFDVIKTIKKTITVLTWKEVLPGLEAEISKVTCRAIVTGETTTNQS